MPILLKFKWIIWILNLNILIFCMEIEDNRPLVSNKFDIPEFLPGYE
jgi:hypothetical protein